MIFHGVMTLKNFFGDAELKDSLIIFYAGN